MKTKIVINGDIISMILDPEHDFEKSLLDSIKSRYSSKVTVIQKNDYLGDNPKTDSFLEVTFEKNER